ncbi:MAG: hypothetical protein ACFFCS_26395 [Candidatus Hodarchaeota archaeon]
MGKKEPEDIDGRPPIQLDDLLSGKAEPKELNELLNEIMEDELEKQFALKQERKELIIEELINASKIYEKMPLERLAIKMQIDLNEILDILEEIILKKEFKGIVISGKELIFKKVPKPADLDQKPFHVMKPAIMANTGSELDAITRKSLGKILSAENSDDSSLAYQPIESQPVQKPIATPLRHKKVSLKFKVLGEQQEVEADFHEKGGGSRDESLKIETEISPIASQLQIKLNMVNNTRKDIEKIQVQFLTSENLKFLRVQPIFSMVGEWGNQLEVPIISASSSRRLLFYFTPLDCNLVEVDILVQYTDQAGNFCDLTSKETYSLNQPNFIKGRMIKDDEIQDKIRNLLKYKGIKSYGLPEELEATEAYLILKEILITNGIELVSEKLLEESNHYVGVYYTKTTRDGKEEDFIVIGQIVNAKMEFFAVSNDPQDLLCGLTTLAKRLFDELKERDIISNHDDLIELFCLSCGGTLSKYPEPEEIYTCKFCGAKLKF